jgi:hypothetical protein
MSVHAGRITNEAMVLAAMNGTQQRLENIINGVEDTEGCKSNKFEAAVQGECSQRFVHQELRFITQAGLYEVKYNTFKKYADIGKNIEVRWRESRPDYFLNIRDTDDKNKYYIFVRGYAPNFEIVGWIKGVDGMQERWRGDPGGCGPAYFIPDQFLNPWPKPGEEHPFDAIS